MHSARPIGVFDSGVGGLAVLDHIHGRLPDADTIYLADQANAPYGSRSTEFIVDRARVLTDRLAALGCEVIVLACNTATASAIDTLRSEFPELSFIGMEPAIKPAAAITESNAIGVLATAGTISAERYEALASVHSAGITIIHRIGEGLAIDVENGLENAPATQRKLAEHAEEFSKADVDVVVLGCTHYSFLARQLAEAGGRRFTVIDPADAVARQVVRIVDGRGPHGGTGLRTYLSTAAEPDSSRFRDLMADDLVVEPV